MIQLKIDDPEIVDFFVLTKDFRPSFLDKEINAYLINKTK